MVPAANAPCSHACIATGVWSVHLPASWQAFRTLQLVPCCCGRWCCPDLPLGSCGSAHIPWTVVVATNSVATLLNDPFPDRHGAAGLSRDQAGQEQPEHPVGPCAISRMPACLDQRRGSSQKPLIRQTPCPLAPTEASASSIGRSSRSACSQRNAITVRRTSPPPAGPVAHTSA